MPQPHLDTAEQFPILSKAPISEAVVEFRCPQTAWIDHEARITKAKENFQEFQTIEHLKRFVSELEFSLGKPTLHKDKDEGLFGFQMKAPGSPNRTLTFNGDLASYSEQSPYTGWEEFRGVAELVWDTYRTIANPKEISRVGLRFINRIPIHGPEFRIEQILRTPPVELSGLSVPFVEFLYSDVLAVPDTHYIIKITRAVVRRDGQHHLVIDIDVACSPGPQMDDSSIIKTLDEMRWLKNKAFFGTITEQAIAELK